MTANGVSGVLYHNVIKSTGNSSVYKPCSSINTNPLTDNYTIGDHIGRGKFAVVKKCTSLETGEDVAAKFIKKRRRGKSCREEILREVVMLEMVLDHPRLVNLKEVYETPAELVLITEYCAGGELFTECILEEKFNESDVRLLIAQILEGLVYLHDKNIVHLDLKPQNILLTTEFPQGSVKICDLGFACLVNIGEDIRDIIGTPDYVAPEVLNYDPLGLYTDMWSLGVLTYVMLTTCSPFAGDDKQETFCNITTVNLDFPQDLFEEISHAAQDFIQKLLIAEPSERMTATECMQHEWITGVLSPSTHPLTEAGDREDTPESTGQSRLTDKSDVHEKVKDEVSEMSVTEEPEGTRSRTISESGVKGMDLTQSDIRPDLTQSDIRPDLTQSDIRPDLTQSDIRPDLTRADIRPDLLLSTHAKSADRQSEKGEGCEAGEEAVDKMKAGPAVLTDEYPTPDSESSMCMKAGPAVLTDEYPTPDSESSMCISDNRLGDDDSGVGTGTETRAQSETRTISRISSTDLITDKEYESESGEDLNPDSEHTEESREDHEMLSKSLLENQFDDAKKGNELVYEISESVHNHEFRVESDLNTNNSTTADESAEMDHSDIIESTDRDEHSNINETADKLGPNHASLIDSNQHRIPDIQPMDQTSPLSNHKFSIGNIYHTADGQLSSPSIGAEDNIIHTVPPCSGEKHKRVMCNPTSTQGEENSENADQEEYEFVSVSKRVKSYEQALTPSPKKEQFTSSPKIARSPRTGRHLKTHHQHH